MLVRRLRSMALRPGCTLFAPSRTFHKTTWIQHGDHGHGHGVNERHQRKRGEQNEENSTKSDAHDANLKTLPDKHFRFQKPPSPEASQVTAIQEECRSITVVGVWTNIGLALSKGVVGVVANSSALIADGLHSLTDLVSDFVTLWTLKKVNQPPTQMHPYGHGKFEALGSLSISAILVGSGVLMGWHSSESLFAGIQTSFSSVADLTPVPVPEISALAVAIFSIAAKELLFRKTLAIGQKANSQVVIGNAWHHRSDSLSSIVSLVGIGASIYIGAAWVDGLAGLIVSAMIGQVGWQVGKSSLHDLTDKAIDQQLLASLHEIIKGVHDVKGFHRLRGRSMGPYITIDVHIEVEPRLSVSAAHRIAERVREAIMDHDDRFVEVLVHVDPEDVVDTPLELTQDQKDKFNIPQKKIEDDVRQTIAERYPEILKISHLTVHYAQNAEIHVAVEVFMEPHLTLLEASTIAKRVETEMPQALSYLDNVDIHLEV